MKDKTWRQYAIPIIKSTITLNKGKSYQEIKAALKEVYPFGERKYHPYKIWCDEINIQLKTKRKKVMVTNQINLFDDETE